jgi:tRNA A-37 threonylcarbamoyl transferase component Bud32
MSTTNHAALVDGRYRLEEVLGRGGMSEVYRAVDRRLGREVAVKWLREPVGDTRQAARARSEALLLARLSHPALVTLFDAGVEAGRPYLVMELVDGPSLARHAPSEPGDVALVGAQLADGLAYIHGEGLVHRDLKPANVLAARTSTPWERVKLADFGIARLLDAARLTATGTAVGTAAYLAPEQVRGEPIGPAADIWSLGLVLLECLTRRRAYPGPPAEAAVARLHRTPDVPAALPGGWVTLLRAMTASDPAARPSAVEVRTGLVHLGTGGTAAAASTWPIPDPPAPDAVPATPPAVMAAMASMAPPAVMAAMASMAAGAAGAAGAVDPATPSVPSEAANPWGAPAGPASTAVLETTRPAERTWAGWARDRARRGFRGPILAIGLALAAAALVVLVAVSAAGSHPGSGRPSPTHPTGPTTTGSPLTTVAAPRASSVPPAPTPATGPAPKHHGGGDGDHGGGDGG